MQPSRVPLAGHVLALAWLRYRLAANRLRGAAGIADVLSGVLMTLVLGLFALGLGAGLGAATYVAVQAEDLSKLQGLLHVAFFLCFFFGVLFPVLRGLMERGLDLSRLLTFPLSHTRLYTVHLFSRGVASDHLFYYPALLAMCLAGALVPGPPALGGIAIVLGLVICNVVWGQVIALATHAGLRLRRLKEVVSVLFVLLTVGVSLLFSSLDFESVFFELMEDPRSFAVVRVAAVLPPAIAAEALFALHRGDPLAASRQGLALVPWCVAGLWIGHFLFSTFHLGDRGRVRRSAAKWQRRESPRRSTAGLQAPDLGRLPVPDELLAAAAKDLRYLFRSLPGKFNLLAAPLIAVLAASIFAGAGRSLLGIGSDTLVFFGLLIYLVLLSSSFANNSFAWEGTGVQSYFFGPAPLTRVLAGKNLAVLAYDGMIFLLGLVSWAVLRDPGAGVVVTGLLLFANAAFALTCAGNFVSILFPAARDMSSMKSQMSQTGILLSFLSLFAIVAVTSLALALPAVLGMVGLQPVFLGLLLAAQVAIYPMVLGSAARLLAHRREALMETLRGRE